MRGSRGLCWAGVSSSEASTKSHLLLLWKDGDRQWVAFHKAWLLRQFANGNDLPDMWMDAQLYWLQPWMLASSGALQLSAEKQRERDIRRDRHQKDCSSPHCLLITLRIPARQIILQWISVEWFNVNKQHSSLAENAGGYVHLGCAPAALLYVHSCLLLYS